MIRSVSGLLLSYHFYLVSRFGFLFWSSVVVYPSICIYLHITNFSVSQGGLDDAGAASVRAILHWQYRTICRGNNSILHNLYNILGPRTHDYISFYGLRAYGNLFDGGPVATSQVYVP